MITLWHNPRCSKSRAALKLLEDAGHRVNLRRYLEDAPDQAELRALIGMLGLQPIDMMRVKEPEFTAMGLSASDDANTLIAAMAARPKLIERPIAIAGGAAVIGRPPERVLDVAPA
ncbi:MAG: arsenate reductase (glutaredoxin) [Sediminimonas sp.]|uniref:arsenate reductase (glutaredoxin) n=1 Tax=Sediminimonas sp. TaxID=2823379 RepID=UPI00286FEB3C|nr:arsenate reductase (glutaredoxin) [Sediminimonas sp.]MDR9484978.1 arsenate reductase (glutaredoxin) [Sediminimonas sp.]